LSDVTGLRLPFEPEWARSNWQSFSVRLPAGKDQRAVMQAMLDKKIATRRGIMNSHVEPAYRKEQWRAGSSLEQSECAQNETILLPLFHAMTEEEQDFVAASLRTALS
jgi:dTDP-4-amino-4,6-dideoxygalactose transaminase